MIIDRYNEFSDAQEVCDAGTTEYSTNVVDLGAEGDAEAKRMRLQIIVNEVFAGSGTTLTVSLETDDNSSFSSATTLWSTAAIAKATLAAKYRITGPSGLVLPSGCERYLRLKYVADATFATTGKLDAFLTHDADSNEF